MYVCIYRLVVDYIPGNQNFYESVKYIVYDIYANDFHLNILTRLMTSVITDSVTSVTPAN